MSSSSWVYCMPDEDVESFTERSDERRQVFEDAARHLPTTELSPLVWALLQVADLGLLRKIAQNKYSWWNVYREDKAAVFEMEALDALRLWKQHSEVTQSTPASNKRSFSAAFTTHSPSPLRPRASTPAESSRTRSGAPLGESGYSPVRSRKVADLCKERDGGLCAVSRVGGVDACHVYPWCAFGGTEPTRVANFWGILGMFWPADKVNLWRSKIFRDGRTGLTRGTETIENMLTLTSTLHRFHSEGAFALRPVRVSADNTQLELEFHWLGRRQRESTARVDLMEHPLSSRDRTDSGLGFVSCRFETPTKPTLLVSGTRFIMTTDDPTNKPLPDPGLLEMQWHLQRILAMSGAAGWKDEEFDYDDPNAAADALPSVEQWLDDQGDGPDQSRGSSPGESVEFVDGM